MSQTVRETDLYPPIKRYLEARGYTVRGEVRDCDVVAVRGDDVIVIELKRHFSSAVLIQAIARQQLTDSVYIAMPRPQGRGMKGKWRGIRRLLRRLELGLIFVDVSSARTKVSIALHPEPYEHKRTRQGRRALLAEFHERSGDYNLGGSTRRPLVTAYREQAIQIARHLQTNGTQSPAALRAKGTSTRTTSILYRNVYGWFVREGRGQYGLSDKGARELKWFDEVVTHDEQ